MLKTEPAVLVGSRTMVLGVVEPISRSPGLMADRPMPPLVTPKVPVTLLPERLMALAVICWPERER